MTGQHLSVLLVEDNPGDARLVREHLREMGSSFEIAHAPTLAEGVALLGEQRFGAVLLDLNLPDSRGLSAIDQVLATDTSAAVVVLTSIDEQELGVEAIQRGAQDYLEKWKLDGQLLVRTLRYAVERKRAEEEREQEWERLKALVDVSPVGVFLVEAASGQVLLINQEAKRLLGLPHQKEDWLEWHKNANFKHVRPNGQEYRLEELPLHRALHHSEIVRAEEVHFRFPDGSVIATLVNATPLRSSYGEVTGAFAVIQDVSPLEEANKVRTEFLGMVSHELKNPLNNIKLSAVLGLNSRGSSGSGETLEMFKMIQEETNRMQVIIDGLLDINQIEAGIIPLTLEPHLLGEILEEAHLIFSRRGRSNPLVFNSTEALPLVSVDRDRILQVLENLLDNAAKYSPSAASISIRVGAEVPYVTLHITDRGCGIPPEKQPLLFKKFARLHSTAEKAVPGTGLGLVICKGIIEAHGGRIWAESPGEGEGSTFSFTLPVASKPVFSTPADATG